MVEVVVGLGVPEVVGVSVGEALCVALGFVVLVVAVGVLPEDTVGEGVGLADRVSLGEADSAGVSAGGGVPASGVAAPVSTGAVATPGEGDDVHPVTTRAAVSRRPGNRTNRGTQGSLRAAVHRGRSVRKTGRKPCFA